MAEKKTTMAEKKTTRGGRTGGSSGGKPKPTLERGMGKNDVTRAYLNSDGPPKIKTTGRTGGSPGMAQAPYQEKPAVKTGGSSKAVTRSGGRLLPQTSGGSAARTPLATGAKNLATKVARGVGRAAGAVGLALTPNNNLAADADKPRGDQGWSGPKPKSSTPAAKPSTPTTKSTPKPKSTPNAKPKSSAPKSVPAKSGGSKPKVQQSKPTGYSQAAKDWAWAERERMLMQRDQARIKRGGK